MNLAQVCRVIDLPEVVQASVLAAGRLPEVERAEHLKGGLEDRGQWEATIKDLAAILGDDRDGMKMLAFMLLRAAETHQRYVALGIDEAIFAETMKFCTRFVIDHHRTHGIYAFTWGWWLPRQLSLQEFRFGALEYELVETASGRAINIHIPGDAVLTPQALEHSHRLARTSLAHIAPDYADEKWSVTPGCSRQRSTASCRRNREFLRSRQISTCFRLTPPVRMQRGGSLVATTCR